MDIDQSRVRLSKNFERAFARLLDVVARFIDGVAESSDLALDISARDRARDVGKRFFMQHVRFADPNAGGGRDAVQNDGLRAFGLDHSASLKRVSNSAWS